MNTSTLISMIAFLGASSVFASGSEDDKSGKGKTTAKTLKKENPILDGFTLGKPIIQEDIDNALSWKNNQAPHMGLRALYATVFLAIGGAGGYFFAKRQSEKSFD